MNGEVRTTLVCVIVVSATLSILAAPAAAHDTETDGGYEITFGGSDEPIITGERQWLEIEIVDAESGDPVEGAGESLTVTVQKSGADEAYEADAEARHGEPGWYDAAIFFTEPGEYAVTVEGTVDGTEISTTFQKTVEEPDDLMYPEPDDGDASSALGAGFGAGAALVAVGALGAVLLARRD